MDLLGHDGAPFAIAILSVFCITASCGASPYGPAHADTIQISLREAERRFLEGNIRLFAARLGIEAARGAEVQAGIWPNPTIGIEQNIYNPATRRTFDFTGTGNSEIQLLQLVQLSGKRDKQTRLAQGNTAIAEAGFRDLVRSLKTQLRIDYYDLSFLQRSLGFYEMSLASLRSTVTAAEQLYQGRSILLGELLRLKSLLFTLENERLGLMNQETNLQEDLRILLADTSNTHSVYVPRLAPSDALPGRVQLTGLDSALDAALHNRPDLHSAEASLAGSRANLELQKALAVPDVTVGGRWSRAGSYIPDYFAMSVSVDLPLFNRNQGNIVTAERNLEMSAASLASLRQQVKKDVRVAWGRAVAADMLLQNFDPKFTGEYQTLVRGMIANYEKRNIRIIEFTDFFEAYRTSMLQMFQLQTSRLDAIEALNFATGIDIVPVSEDEGP